MATRTTPTQTTRPTTVEGLVDLAATIMRNTPYDNRMVHSTTTLMDPDTQEADRENLEVLRDLSRTIEGNRITSTRPIAEILRRDENDPSFRQLWRAAQKASDNLRFGL